jgi:hypothetical protein
MHKDKENGQDVSYTISLEHGVRKKAAKVIAYDKSTNSRKKEDFNSPAW